MDTIFKNPVFLLAVYATACYVLTFITRRIVETAKPDLKEEPYTSTFSRWWNDVILYTIAPVYGVVLALLLRKTDYFPEEVKGDWVVAVMFGLVCGFTCSWFFKIFKRMLAKAAKVEEKELDDTPDTPEVPGGEEPDEDAPDSE